MYCDLSEESLEKVIEGINSLMLEDICFKPTPILARKIPHERGPMLGCEEWFNKDEEIYKGIPWYNRPTWKFHSNKNYSEYFKASGQAVKMRAEIIPLKRKQKKFHKVKWYGEHVDSYISTRTRMKTKNYVRSKLKGNKYADMYQFRKEYRKMVNYIKARDW